MIVDSLPIVRRALRVLLENQGHEVAGEADNGMDALLLCRERLPELVILELAIPRLGGLDVIRRLKASHAELKILVYSVQDSDLYASRSLQVGADAFVSKLEDLSELGHALTAVIHGRSYFPRTALHAQEIDAGTADEASEIAQLSSRELTVLQLLAQGMSNQRIAEQLSISHKTVSTYKMRLQQKLHVESTIKMVEIARRSGALAWEGASGQEEPGAANPEQMREYGMLRALLDSAPAPMFVRDPEGRLLMCNRPFLDYHAVGLGDVQGRTFRETQWLSPERREQVQQRYEQAVARGEAISVEIATEMHGQPRVLHVWFAPYRDELGQTLGMLGGLQDLTARDVLLAELRNANLLAQAESRSKSQALAGVDRELTPLLRLQASLLNQALSHATPGSGEHAAIVSAAEVLDAMHLVLGRIDRLVRLDAEQPALVPEAQRLGELTRQASAPLQERARDRGGSLLLDLSGVTVDDVWIDSGHYRQLLELLAGHTCAALPGTALELALRTRPLPGGFVVLLLTLRGEGGEDAPLLAEALDTLQPGLEAVQLQGLLKKLGASVTKVEAAGEPAARLGIEIQLLPVRP